MSLKTNHLIFVVIFSTLVKIACGQGNTYDCRRLNDCQNGGTCDMNNGTCSCQTGYSGYNCQIIDGTTCASLTCNNGGTCYVDNTVDTCGCVYGFFGQTCDNETAFVRCEGTTVQFSLSFPEVFSGTVELSGSDASAICSFATSSSDGFTTYSLTIDTEQDSTDTSCGRETLVITGDTTADANYTGMVEARFFPLIVTYTDQLFKFTCQHIGGDVDVSKEITNIVFDPEGNLTEVEVLKPYSPVSFEVVDNAGGILTEGLYVGDSYKICFFLTDTSVYKNVYIKSCTTNNTLESPDNKTYDIYNEGCPTQKSMRTTSIQEAANKTIDDVTYPSVCLPITAFRFIDSDNLALTCKIQLCKENDSSCDLPTVTDCDTVIQNEGATTTDAPDTNTTDSMNTNSTDGNSTTDATGNNDNSTTDATGNNDNSTTDATDATGNNDNSTTDATGSGNDNSTSAPNNGDGGGDTTDATGGGNDATTDAGNRRRRRSADDIEEKTVSTIIKVYGGQRVSTTDTNQGQVEATVEECLSRSEIMAVVTVLGSTVIVLFIACFILICVLIKRKSKMTLFEPHPHPKPDRFQIPRAHVNQAYREI